MGADRGALIAVLADRVSDRDVSASANDTATAGLVGPADEQSGFGWARGTGYRDSFRHDHHVVTLGRIRAATVYPHARVDAVGVSSLESVSFSDTTTVIQRPRRGPLQ
jgi:hypothetical protein